MLSVTRGLGAKVIIEARLGDLYDHQYCFTGQIGRQDRRWPDDNIRLRIGVLGKVELALAGYVDVDRFLGSEVPFEKLRNQLVPSTNGCRRHNLPAHELDACLRRKSPDLDKAHELAGRPPPARKPFRSLRRPSAGSRMLHLVHGQALRQHAPIA